MKHQRVAKYLQELLQTFGSLGPMAKQVLDNSLLDAQYVDHPLQLQKNCKSKTFKKLNDFFGKRNIRQ